MEAIYFFSLLVTRADLSRLGRDYVSVGYYTDNYFPDRNIRFIAINDMIDSAEGENEIAPFKNIMNEMYARDISRKIRSAHRIRGNMGEPLSQPPYGYIKSPENKKKWIVEPEAAAVVRRIFRLCMEGKGNEAIAHILQEEKILVPSEYWKSIGVNKPGTKNEVDPYKWGRTTVAKILTQQEYCGDVINFKTYSKSFKNKTRFYNPEENWVVFKNVHEPIIDRETFERVQAMIKNTKRRVPKKENGEKSMFSDILYCADCGKKLWYHTNTTNKNIHYFSCSNYVKDYRGTCTSRHYVREDAIDQVVTLELQRLASFLKADEESFAELLAEKANKDMLTEKRRIEAELQKSINRNETVARLYEKLYEDNATGKVSDEWFMELSHKYEQERITLKQKITDYRTQLSELSSDEQNKTSFISAVRKFMEMKTITAPLLRELIDHIDVYETQGVGKNRSQRIAIYYRFVGYIKLPDFLLTDNIKADTRNGVEVQYITQGESA